MTTRNLPLLTDLTLPPILINLTIPWGDESDPFRELRLRVKVWMNAYAITVLLLLGVIAIVHTGFNISDNGIRSSYAIYTYLK
jgi:hypothetical protein